MAGREYRAITASILKSGEARLGKTHPRALPYLVET
jgi:hypothetical protein